MNYFPKFIGKYQIDSLIGSGSCGQVLKAYDQQLLQWVAIKLLYSCQEQTLEQEAQLLASIHHPNVVNVYNIIQDKNLGQTALVMEYLPCNTLREVLDCRYTINLKAALSYCLDITKGLSAIHQQGIVHCDLKPENIFLNTQNHLKIGDFGIAKVLNQSSKTSMLGSYCCLSPEQILDGMLTPQSDLFSLGILLYQMLAGHHPFEQGDNVELMLNQLINSPSPPLICKVQSVTHLVTKLLAKSPSERYQSANEVIVVIEEILNVELKGSEV